MLIASDKAVANTVARAIPEPELGFWRGAQAAADDYRYTMSSDATANLMRDDLDATVVALQNATGDFHHWRRPGRGAFDIRATLTQLRDAEPLLQTMRGEGIEVATADEIEAKARQKIAQVRRMSARAGFGATAAGMAAGAFGDPVNALGMAFGAAAGASILRQALIEAGVNAGLETLVQGVAATDQERQRLGIDPTLGEAAGAVAGAGVGAAGLVVGLRSLGKLFDRVVGDGTMPAPTREQRLAREAVDAGAELAESQPIPGVRGQAAHAEAMVEAVRAVDAGRAPEITPIYQRRFADVLARFGQATETVGRAVDAVSEARAARRTITQPGGARNLLLLARNHLATLGQRATVETDGGKVRLRLDTIGGGQRVVELPKEASRVEARAAVDVLTDDLGFDRLPLSRAEEAGGSVPERMVDLARAERVRQEAQALRERVHDGVMLDRGASGTVRPFKTRKAAEAFGRATFGDGFDVVKSGRGFGLVEAESAVAKATRAAVGDVGGVPIPREDSVAAAAKWEAEVADLERQYAEEAKRPVQYAADDSVPPDLVAEVDRTRRIIVVDEDGNSLERAVGDVLDELSEDEEALRFMRACVGS